MYGAYTETLQVSSVAAGYKSAHLLWPSGTCDGCEDDFPENSWTDGISALDGTSAAPNSSAQLNIRSVSVYSYTGA
jgi:hypothetical protein